MKNLIINLASIFFACTTLAQKSAAQHSIGLKVNGGLSRLMPHSQAVSHKLKFSMPSWHAGIFYCWKPGKSSEFGIELLYVSVRGKETGRDTRFIPGVGGTVRYHFSTDLLQYINYIGIPVYYGFRFKKLAVNLGGQVNFKVNSGGKYTIYLKNTNTEEIHKSNYLKIGSFAYGARAGITFNLSRRFAIEGTYYYGINTVGNDKYADYKWKIRQMTVGMRYAIFSSGGRLQSKK